MQYLCANAFLYHLCVHQMGSLAAHTLTLISIKASTCFQFNIPCWSEGP